MKEKTINNLLIVGLLIFALSFFLFIYFFFLKPKPPVGLKINFQGPSEVLALEDYEYQITVENYSNQQLKNVILKISLPEGAFSSQRLFEKIINFSIGDLNPKEKYENKISLFFFNAGNERETVNLVVNYETGSKGHIFSKELNFSILVKNSPIQFQAFLPSKVYVNQPFQVNFALTNISSKKLNNLQVTIDPPHSFVLSSTFPTSENFFWLFPSISSKETKNISIIGQVQDFTIINTFSLQVSFEYEGINFSLPKEIVKLNTLENPIAFYIKSTPEGKVIKLGSGIFYDITLENKSQTVLEDGEVKITFEGPFNFISLDSDGYFDQNNKTLIWNNRYKNELISIKPGDKINFKFSIGTYESYPILGEKEKDFYLKIRAEFKTPTIPAEVETGNKEYVIFQEDEKKIIGDLEISSNIFYNDQYFPGEGPFPLEANQQTTLTWHIYVKTIGEDFENLNISGRLPPYVSLTNKVAGDAILENLKYNPKTGDFLYVLKNVPANLGYLKKELDLAFQIAINPSANIDLRNLLIIPSIQYSAKGSFSQFQINKSITELRTFNVIYQ
jgi:hypothetical protein